MLKTSVQRGSKQLSLSQILMPTPQSRYFFGTRFIGEGTEVIQLLLSALQAAGLEASSLGHVPKWPCSG